MDYSLWDYVKDMVYTTSIVDSEAVKSWRIPSILKYGFNILSLTNRIHVEM
jgi:hypothetical protein